MSNIIASPRLPPEQDLGDGLVLRSPRDEADAQRFVSYYEEMFGPRLAVCPGYLTRHHPVMRLGDFQFVEDTASGRIVSTTCLIPWRLSYEGISLRAAQLEYVATRPEYRHRGLVRAQMQRFHQLVADGGYDLSLIEGIPYYYRQFGYAYVLDHRSYDSLPSWRIPAAPGGQQGDFGVRAATIEDVPALHRLYAQAMAALPLHVERDMEYWRFLLQWVRLPAHLLVDGRDGAIAGYYCPLKLGERGIKIIESALPGSDVALELLRRLTAETTGEVQIAWPQADTLVRVARSLGSVPQPTYQWLVRITEPVRFLEKIGPALERRLAASGLERLTAGLRVNLYRTAYALDFRDGKLERARDIGFQDSSMFADGGDLCIPPDAFIRLVLGYRGLAELRDAWPDIVVKPESRHILDALFPRMQSGLRIVYDYCGPSPAEGQS